MASAYERKLIRTLKRKNLLTPAGELTRLGRILAFALSYSNIVSLSKKEVSLLTGLYQHSKLTKPKPELADAAAIQFEKVPWTTLNKKERLRWEAFAQKVGRQHAIAFFFDPLLRSLYKKLARKHGTIALQFIETWLKYKEERNETLHPISIKQLLFLAYSMKDFNPLAVSINKAVVLGYKNFNLPSIRLLTSHANRLL